MPAVRLPRDLHPVAWWVWALGLATAASFTTNPLLLLLLIGVATLVVLARRSDQPWAASFRLYVWSAVVIVVVRVLFRILFGGVDGGTVLIDLPEIPLPDWVRGHPPARAGHARGAAGRALRRPAARRPW